MADWQCWPLWESGAPEYNVDPASLPISQRLRDDLTAWADMHDATLNRDYPPSSGFPDLAAANQWLVNGADLATRLREELPSDFQVQYDHETDEPASWLADDG
jgi:hypothetical protein